ncbi:MAG: hypoxanthine phosphoribosyltransferase [Chloroflexi bacterium]|nr:hypoxanthine phosphoribosyltransferase [Chloroflexota bacterium]
MAVQDYREYLKEILIPEDKLQARITELAQQISQDYAGKDLVLVCILRGGVMFLTDLMRRLTVPHEIEFMAVESYGKGAREPGELHITMDLRTAITGRDVLLVEDIIDSGHTVAQVLQLLEMRQPKSLKVCALLDKHERRQVDVPIDYVGFTIPNYFVFGYGLDMDGYWRNLPFIAVPDLTRYQGHLPDDVEPGEEVGAEDA